ncbi:isochorismatase family protein [Pseudoalteromonas sp. PS5]|uniref:isochorismatase family protein n=1 Tax=Pseudoalteromonas sp. PS5 TaxID=1437473 RepID=UPI001F4F9FA8|nr:isochorismatase family protein [Pseudoalteromonas sp. PS5]
MMNLIASDCMILVIDIQEKFRPHIAEFDAIENQVTTLLNAARYLSIPALIFEQYPKGLGHSAPNLLKFDLPIIEKTAFSAYYTEDCKQTIQSYQRDTVIVVGLESHICVQQTVNDLLADNFNVVIAADAICSRNPKHTQWALAQMQADGARFLAIESILFQWLKTAKNEQFKAISALVK